MLFRWFAAVLCLGWCSCQRTEESAKAFFEEVDRNSSLLSNRYVIRAWDYVLDLDNETKKQAQNEISLEAAAFDKRIALEVREWDWQSFENATLKKAFYLLNDMGTAALEEDDLKELNAVQREMEEIYAGGTVCSPTDASDCKTLEPDLTRILATSKDYEELTWVWQGWRDATGRKMKDLYARYVALMNKAARANGFSDAGESWRGSYIPNPKPPGPDYDFRADLDRLNAQMRPLYRVLHRYVKDKLKETYGAHRFPASGHIPAHLLGNMWAQSWSNLYEGMKPFPDVTSSLDITSKLESLTVTQLFEVGDEFFTSMGLAECTPEFWNNSVFERIPNRKMVCHASAWDFSDGKDFRIKMCTDKTLDDFQTIHHELGHIQYYLQYRTLAQVFRRGANPGFHEALGDLIGLSVTTPKHLQEIGYLENYVESPEADLNYLMSIALDKVSFLPFAQLMDDWRWAVFDGTVTPDNYNTEWWKRRCKYQGVSPPVRRTDEDFDPGAKYHIPASTPYVRYLVSYVIQFQFYRDLCRTTNHQGPLYKCDFYRSHEAGNRLASMMQKGQIEDWQTVLESITGSRNMDASAIVEYFQPVIDHILNVTGQTDPESSYFDWDEECSSFDVSGSAHLPPTQWLATILLVISAFGMSFM